VVNQLIKSYENRRIDLFRDLFSPAGTYRFYISRSYIIEYVSNNSAIVPEQITAPLVADISPGSYYYWTYVDEIKKHEKLFEAVEDIQFTVRPAIPLNGIQYLVTARKETLSSAIVADTLQVTTRTVLDTTGATVILRDGEITITASQYFSEPAKVAIETQVFYLARDPADSLLWVIDKWFDLGTQ
jgi:hypothetical protein